jgi:hypothetical protein
MIDDIEKLDRELEDLTGQVLVTKKLLTAKERRRLARELKRIIAFNSQCETDMEAFETVGVGGAIEEILAQLKTVARAKRLLG